MKKYYFNKLSKEKEYGIYESLLENQNRIDYNNNKENIFKEKKAKLKSLGAVNRDEYLFYVGDIDKLDHIGLTNIIEDKIGLYNYWFSFWYKKEFLQYLNIYYTTNAESKTLSDELKELEYLMGIVSECQLYNNINVNNEWKVEIVLPSIFSEIQEDKECLTPGECLNIIQKRYSALKSNIINNFSKEKVLTLYQNKKN